MHKSRIILWMNGEKLLEYRRDLESMISFYNNLLSGASELNFVWKVERDRWVPCPLRIRRGKVTIRAPVECPDT